MEVCVDTRALAGQDPLHGRTHEATTLQTACYPLQVTRVTSRTVWEVVLFQT